MKLNSSKLEFGLQKWTKEGVIFISDNYKAQPNLKDQERLKQPTHEQQDPSLS